MTTPAPQAGWYPDPSGTHGQLYWDGHRWVPPTSELAAASNPERAAAPAQLAPYPQTHTPAYHAGQQPATYVYKNPLLYAFGGLFFPPLVLFLMGGDRKTCLIMLGLWGLYWLTVWFFFIGFVFWLVLYPWSVISCYQEAVKQNKAHGFA
jgi:hypothetical protein